MSSPRLIRYESPAELRHAAEPWNDLWRRSPGVLPTARAELIVAWLEQLAPDAKFVALAVEQDGQLIAALPLMQNKLGRLVNVGAMPRNMWSWAGDLLLDPAADANAALAVLTSEIRRLSWPLLWFNAVPLESPRWQQMLIALDEAGLAHTHHQRFRMGTVEIVDDLHRDWAAYETAWSGNHRRHIRKAARRADENGGVELNVRRPESAEEIESLLREGFEVEHRSWKGEGGTSVIASPTEWNFYLREATELARLGYLELSFLRHHGRAIAFEYGWSSRNIYYTPKVGFDSVFSNLSPGQLLRYFVLRRSFKQTDRHSIDFLGPLSEATAKWATRSYPICKLVVATDKFGGRGLLSLYRHVAKSLRKFRGQPDESGELKIVEVDRPTKNGLSPIAVEA